MNAWTNPPLGPVVGQAGCATLLAQSFIAVSCPSDVTEDTLASITVPANLLGANGALRITTWWSFTNNANNKTLRVRYSGGSGTAFMSNLETTGTPNRCVTEIANRGATNSQFGGTQIGTVTGIATATATAAVDTTAATTLLITGQKAVNTDALTLEGYVVEVIR